jgi:hypothetical protein
MGISAYKCMKSTLLILVNLIICFTCLAQMKKRPSAFDRTNIQTVQVRLWLSLNPDWNNDHLLAAKKFSGAKDSVFVFYKKNYRKDSILFMVQEFDSLGNITDREERSFKTGEIFRITNFTYQDNLLFKKEEITKRISGTSDSLRPKKNITTYEYDSAGNLSTQKLYEDFNDSTGAAIITEFQKEYDNQNRILTESERLQNGELFVHLKYLYNDDGKIREVKAFNQKREWQYSFLHEYEKGENAENVFIINGDFDKIIQLEINYDGLGRRIRIKEHPISGVHLGSTIQTFSYGANGLTERQSYEDENGIDYYMKHIYAPNK